MQSILQGKLEVNKTINLINELKEYAKSLEEPDSSDDELDKAGL